MAETYNRYRGNSGHVERVETPASAPKPSRPRASAPVSPPPPPNSPPGRSPPPLPSRPSRPQNPPDDLSGLSRELSRLLGKLSLNRLETEDLILLLILYLLYRETGDKDFLLMGGTMLL